MYKSNNFDEIYCVGLNPINDICYAYFDCVRNAAECSAVSWDFLVFKEILGCTRFSYTCLSKRVKWLLQYVENIFNGTKFFRQR